MRPEARHRQTGLPYLRIIPAVILGYAKRISHFRIGWRTRGEQENEEEVEEGEGDEGEEEEEEEEEVE